MKLCSSKKSKKIKFQSKLESTRFETMNKALFQYFKANFGWNQLLKDQSTFQELIALFCLTKDYVATIYQLYNNNDNINFYRI